MTTKKGDEQMTTLQLKDIEKRVASNSRRNRNRIVKATKKIQSQNLKRGRVRSRDSVEAEILARFNKE